MAAVAGTSARVVMLAVVVVMTLIVSPAYAFSGTASFYRPPYIPSACYGNENSGNMVAAASDAFWGNRAACGRKYRCRCTGATNQGPAPCKPNTSVDVTIVDYCPPSGCHATIDLARAVFNKIANLDAGIIKINCQQI